MTRYGSCHTLIQLQIPSAPHLSWSWHHDGCCRDAQMQEEAQPLRLCNFLHINLTQKIICTCFLIGFSEFGCIGQQI